MESASNAMTLVTRDPLSLDLGITSSIAAPCGRHGDTMSGVLSFWSRMMMCTVMLLLRGGSPESLASM